MKAPVAEEITPGATYGQSGAPAAAANRKSTQDLSTVASYRAQDMAQTVAAETVAAETVAAQTIAAETVAAEPAPDPRASTQSEAPSPQTSAAEDLQVARATMPGELAAPTTACVGTLSKLAERSVVYFQRGGVSLSRDQATLLSAFIEMAADCPQSRIEIMGHTDNVGAEATNLSLSWQRAEIVATQFTKNGVDRDRLRVIGFGGKRPLLDNGTSSSQAVNRRVDFAISQVQAP